MNEKNEIIMKDFMGFIGISYGDILGDEALEDICSTLQSFLEMHENIRHIGPTKGMIDVFVNEISEQSGINEDIIRGTVDKLQGKKPQEEITITPQGIVSNSKPFFKK